MISLEEELSNSGKRHWINFKDPSGETEREMFFCVEDYLMQKKALEIISQNFKLVGNCLHAKNKYAKDGWVFVKELEDEEEHNAWKEVLL